MQYQRTQRGFSLTELMIAMALSATVLAGVYGIFAQQRRVATRQDQVLEARHIARLTMDSLVEELRGAGFDPGGLAGAGIVAANATQIRFTRDLNCNGTLASSNTAAPAKGVPDIPPGLATSDEDIGYTLTTVQVRPLIREVRRRVYADGGATPVLIQPVASNILNLQFCYFLTTLPAGDCTTDSDDLTPSDLPNIRAVQVTVTARATAANPDYNDPDPNQNPFFRHYHKATLTSMVRLRNLGIALSDAPGLPSQPIDFDQTCALP